MQLIVSLIVLLVAACGGWRPFLSECARLTEKQQREQLTLCQFVDTKPPASAEFRLSDDDRGKAKRRELVDGEDPSTWQGTVKINREKMRSGKSCFELSGKYQTGIESALIPVDTSKTYRLSCSMRSLDDDHPASGSFGLKMYDRKKRPITTMTGQAVKNSGWMPSDWKELAFAIRGEAREGSSFCRGTQYVRVFVWFGNYDKTPKPGAVLLVDDIHFTEELN
ncbi:MAG: hypothetical protein PHV34_13330 [Verrucomicrobiae bacterium]|nr:hypothetical protein [Verrucomicrobiae bacterium]